MQDFSGQQIFFSQARQQIISGNKKIIAGAVITLTITITKYAHSLLITDYAYAYKICTPQLITDYAYAYTFCTPAIDDTEMLIIFIIYIIYYIYNKFSSIPHSSNMCVHIL